VQGRTFVEVREMHDRGETTPLRDLRPELPEAFLAIVEQSLAVDANERFSTCDDVARAIREFLDGSPGIG
jgi:hypothetical protein